MAKTIKAQIIKKIDEVSAIAKVNRLVVHPVYGKRLKRSKKLYCHDLLKTKVGDLVELEETRPLSKLKRWQVKKIFENI